jgi:hypothetical protein
MSPSAATVDSDRTSGVHEASDERFDGVGELVDHVGHAHVTRSDELLHLGERRFVEEVRPVRVLGIP